ncbi:hypothetical protein FCV25MIE_04668 [Fagus crenata]
MDTSGYAKAGTSRNTTYDDVSVNPTDERSAIHYTKDDISRMTFKTVTEWEEWYKHYSFLMGFGLRREDVRTDRNGEVITRKWIWGSGVLPLMVVQWCGAVPVKAANSERRARRRWELASWWTLQQRRWHT